ncbi:MAG: DUF368 domain-containing protein [Moraxellaceae bacterium]|nr:MAG: DUF368 domain-containing protein [Moraxellaceae bacterium]
MKQHSLLYAKGIAMGAADVVPGVSGGTIAFLTGIYEELLSSIKSVGPGSIKILFSQGPKACWASINGNFLLVLLLGIGTSIVSLARVITHLLTTYPTLLWSFFFGLILVSSLYMVRQIKGWGPQNVASLLIGAVIAYTITILSPSEIEATPITIFLAGSVAICAMILPGISGSFILLLLGMYSHIMGAIKAFDMDILAVFAVGCITGLLLFSRFLSWLLARYHEVTMALLTGFMLGSLNKVWPWKQTLEWRENSHGVQVPLTQENLSPFSYAEILGQDHQLAYCLGLAILAIVIVLGIEQIASRKVD